MVLCAPQPRIFVLQIIVLQITVESGKYTLSCSATGITDLGGMTARGFILVGAPVPYSIFRWIRFPGWRLP